MLNKLQKTAEVLFDVNKVPMGKRGFITHKIPKKATEIHSFTIGSSGAGKSRHMLFRIERAIERGDGVALIDPKGDIYRLLLKSIYDKIIQMRKRVKKLMIKYCPKCGSTNIFFASVFSSSAKPSILKCARKKWRRIPRPQCRCALYDPKRNSTGAVPLFQTIPVWEP